MEIIGKGEVDTSKLLKTEERVLCREFGEIRNKLEEIHKIGERLEVFASINNYNFEDLYNKLATLNRKSCVAEGELKSNKVLLSRLGFELRQLERFGHIDEVTVKEVLNMSYEITNYSGEKGDNDFEQINGKIRYLNKKDRRHRKGMMVALFSSMGIFIYMVVSKALPMYFLFILALAGCYIFEKLRNKVTREISEVSDEITLHSLDEGTKVVEVNNMKSRLCEILNSVGASSVENFLILKSKHDNIKENYEVLKKRTDDLQGELDLEQIEIEEIYDLIEGGLERSMLFDEDETNIYLSKIRKFDKIKSKIFKKQEIFNANLDRSCELLGDYRKIQNECNSLCDNFNTDCEERKKIISIDKELIKILDFLNNELSTLYQ